MKFYTQPFAIFIPIILLFITCKKEEPTPYIPSSTAPLLITMQVVQDPFEMVPLAANLIVKTTRPCQVEYTIMGEHPVIKTSPDFQEETVIPVLGLYGGIENMVVIQLTDSDGYMEKDTVFIETPPNPSLLPNVEIVKIDAGRKESGFTFAMYEVISTTDSHSFPFIMDDAGEIRWYMNLKHVENLASPGEFLDNGNLIFGFGGFICEFSLLGEEINRFSILGYHQHHDIFEKEDGNLLIAVTKNGDTTYNDFIIELNPFTQEIVREFDLRQPMDEHRTVQTANTSDWAHVNSIFHDAASDNIIISARTQGIFAISMDNGLQWILAGHQGWGQSGNGEDLNNYLLTAVDANGTPYENAVQLGTENTMDFGWTFGQHSAEVLPNGNIIAFDNGSKRNYSTEQEYSRGVEFSIDKDAMTTQQIWTYGEDRNVYFYSQYEGDMDVLPMTNNRLMVSAKSQIGIQKFARITEVTEFNEVVFEAYIPFPTLPTERGTGVYRAERMRF